MQKRKVSPAQKQGSASNNPGYIQRTSPHRRNINPNTQAGPLFDYGDDYGND